LSFQQVHATESECAELRQLVAAKKNATDIRQADANLFQAADKGCLDVAQDMLAKGANPLARRNNGESALHIAARAGEVEIAALLIEHGAKIELRDLKGATPLFIAAESKRKNIVKLLLEHGAIADAPGRSETTPLSAAAFNGNDTIIRQLLAAGAKPATPDQSGKSPIIYAAARGFKSIVEVFLSAGVDINAKYEHSLTLLMWASGHSNDVPPTEGLALATMLVDRGAKFDEVDDRGKSALIIATELGHIEIVQELLRRGANRSIKDKEGKSAADFAVGEAMKALLAAP
jgi:ankyrin repeat protein